MDPLFSPYEAPRNLPTDADVEASNVQKAYVVNFNYYGIDHKYNDPRNFDESHLAVAVSDILKKRDGSDIQPAVVQYYYEQARANVRRTRSRWDYFHVARLTRHLIPEDKNEVEAITSFQLDAVVVSSDRFISLICIR